MSSRTGAAISPTPAEMEILEVLWPLGSATVREVHEALAAARTTGYTTVLKLMQIMVTKGLLIRDESSRSHVYTPAVAREAVQRTLVGELVERAFAGSTSALVMRALASERASAEELAEIRDMLDELEAEQPRSRARKRRRR